MKFNRLLVLLPCHSLENLETDRSATEAAQLLAAWTALYHPALISAAHAMPSWASANMASRELSNALVFLPECSRSHLPDDWLADAESTEATVLPCTGDRAALVSAALALLEEQPARLDPELAADFLALGYCHLTVELLTRKLRYMSNLDETAFRTSLIAAADAAVQGDGETARTHLQGAFDRLHDAREYFYPTEPRLLDLTLLAETTLGESLRADLNHFAQPWEDAAPAEACGARDDTSIPTARQEPRPPDAAHAHDERGHGAAGVAIRGMPRNFLLSSEVLNEMADREPSSLAALKESLAQKTASIVGGEYTELPLPLLSPEAIAANLECGLAVYESVLGSRPKVFGRRKFGLTLALPQILKKLGFAAALHFTLDDGQFPTGNQSRTQWEGFDGTTIEAIARVPLDVSTSAAFLALPKQLGNCMELDHSPAMLFAHWPGKVSPWYDDLRRIAGYSRVLGYFCTIDDFIEQTPLAGQRVQYQIDEYRSPYLAQDAATGGQDAVSRWVEHWRRESVDRGTHTLNALSATISPKPIDQPSKDSPEAAAGEFSENLGGPPSVSGRYSTAEKGYLLVNPLSFSQRHGVRLPELNGAPATSDAVRAAAENVAVVDLPSMGFVWIPKREGEAPAEPSDRASPSPPLAGEYVLRNEFFEINFDPTTGAIRAVLDYKSRHPRLAQQIALRMPQGESEPASDKHYSIMAADEFRIAAPNAVFGEMLCRGRLMDREGNRVAGFEQVTRIWRGSRVIEIDMEIDPERLPDARPWNSYYACRFAWHDETSSLFRSVNLANQPTEMVQLESPLFIDIRSGKQRTTILSGGLPYHRRIGPRRLDSLLIVAGETARRFRIGVGIDLPNPTTAALGFLQPPVTLFTAAKPPAASGWLFHLDHRNVVATSWQPMAGGFRVRLLETEGRPAQLKLRCFKNVAAAQKLETGDAPPAELNIDGDTIHIPMTAYQWIDLEVQFRP
jgi:alpha-mannosidase